MRIMGLDVGDKTIGVAVSDEFGWTAQGVGVIQRKELDYDLNQLAKIMDEYNVEEILLGLPKNMNGTIGYRAEGIIQLAEIIKDRLKVPVLFMDERLTTVMAERTLIEADVSRRKRKKVIDKMAAILILQGYLDMKR
ncbi:MAG: Holliday junction resolvase RuvX [Vulcanibacillus sp.]